MTLDVMSLTNETVSDLASKCWNGEAPACSRGCPFNLDVRGFIDKVSRGRWQAAYKAYRGAVVFPELIAEICPAPCETGCPRRDKGGAVNLHEIERAAARYTRDKSVSRYALPPRPERIAVVGAGPAGLSAALSFSQKNYAVTVYEASDAWGGSLKNHEQFGVFDAEFTESFKNSGVEFLFNTPVNSPDELSGFDAVYLANGTDSFGIAGAGFDTAALWKTGTNIFAGGGVLGHGAAQSVADGKRASVSVETYLQTGKPSPPAVTTCTHTPDVSREDASARIEAPPEGYSQEDAKSEANRCFRCDCTGCMDGCEMLRRYRKLPPKIASEVFADTRANPPYSSHTITRQAFSCNDCGYCASRCMEGVDTGEILRLSRRARQNLGQTPPAFHDYWLREMEFSNSKAGYYSAGQGKSVCEYLFFPGCQLGAYTPAHVVETYKLLSGKYNAGIYLGCCGAPSFWAGDDARSDGVTAEILSVWEKLGKPKFIYACLTCRRMLRELAPEIETVSLYGLLETDALPIAAGPEYAVFDPCSARDDAVSREAVRSLLTNAGITASELPETGKCCGYGGLISAANPGLYEEITENRSSASGLPYVTYCANCRNVFARRGKESRHVLDVVLGTEPPAPPDIDTKRRNSLYVKGEIMKITNGEVFVPPSEPWDAIEIIIEPDLFERCDRKLIALSDMREAIYKAELNNSKFIRENGECHCNLITPALTYWVTYKPLGGGKYEVTDAYSHRMRFEEANK